MMGDVHLYLACRWFCRLGPDGAAPDHSTFSKKRHGCFRESDLLRRLSESALQRCVADGLVGGEGFAVDTNLTQADAADRDRVEAAAVGDKIDAAHRRGDLFQKRRQLVEARVRFCIAPPSKDQIIPIREAAQ
jgi:Transposase domain (DUF772)